MSHSIPARVLSFLLATAPLCVAQERLSPLRHLPEEALMVMQMDGPAVLGERMAKTRLARMLAGPELEPVRKDVERFFETKWSGFEKEQPALLQASRRLWAELLAFDGRVTMAVGADQDADQKDEVEPWFTVVLSPGRTSKDLAKIGEHFVAAVEADDDAKLRDLKVDGRTFRILEVGEDGAAMSMPAMLDQDLVLFFGAGLEKRISRALDPKGRHLESLDEQLGGHAFAAHFGVKRSLDLLVSVVEASGLPFMGDGDLAKLLAALGAGSLESMRMQVDANGEYVVGDFLVEFNAQPKGFFDAMTPQADGPPRMLELVPRHLRTWNVGTMRLMRFYEAVGEVVEVAKTLPIGMETGMEELEKMFQDFFRVRLKEDLLAHLGSEYLMVNSMTQAPDAEGEDMEKALAGADGLCICLALQDSAAFDTSFDKLLRSRGLHTSRKTEDYKGTPVHRIRLLGAFEMHYTISERAFLVGLGARGAQSVRAVLDEEKARKEGKPVEKFPPAVAARLALAVPDWNGIGVAEIEQSLQDGWSRIVPVLERDAEDDEDTTRLVELLGKTFSDGRLAKLLETYQLTELVQVSRFDGKRLVQRAIW